MAEFPALPVFTDAFIGDTLHLDAAQVGGYWLMLLAAWRSPACDLPDDDKMLARICRMDARAWAKNGAVLKQFWASESGRLYQKRLRGVRKFVSDKSNKNSHNAQARWLKDKETGDANALPNGCERIASKSKPKSTQRVIKPQSPFEKDKSVDNSAGLGSKSAGSVGSGFDIRKYLNDSALEAAKKNAPGWDIYYLINTYNEGVKGRGIPDKPAGAFIAWCAKYSKLKPPD